VRLGPAGWSLTTGEWVDHVIKPRTAGQGRGAAAGCRYVELLSREAAAAHVWSQARFRPSRV
jgi:hypothetical protein